MKEFTKILIFLLHFVKIFTNVSESLRTKTYRGKLALQNYFYAPYHDMGPLLWSAWNTPRWIHEFIIMHRLQFGAICMQRRGLGTWHVRGLVVYNVFDVFAIFRWVTISYKHTTHCKNSWPLRLRQRVQACFSFYSLRVIFSTSLTFYDAVQSNSKVIKDAVDCRNS